MRPAIPEVVLPCDLPYWPAVQSLLLELQHVDDTDDLVRIMARIQAISNVSVDPAITRPDHSLEAFRSIVADQFPLPERARFFVRTLPCMARYAVSLKELKPSSGLPYCLRGFPSEHSLDRRFVSSLVANAFFSTFAYRPPNLLPSLADLSFSTLFGRLDHLLPQALRLRAFLNYFDILDVEEPCGHVVFTRRSNVKAKPIVPPTSKPLAPVYITQDPSSFDVDGQTSEMVIRNNRYKMFASSICRMHC